MSEHDREISGKAICPRCLCQFQHHSRPQLYECLVEQAIDVKRKSGLPAPGLRILPPRPPNVAALLDEEARPPESKVEAVMRSASTMRTVLRPIFDYVPLSDKLRGEVWSAMKEYDDSLADLNRKGT